MRVPLGGGATIFECLVAAWKSRPGLDLRLVAPGPDYPELRNATRLSLDPATHPASLGYAAYARFSREFERVSTNFILSHGDTPRSWVIANDICEEPDLPRLRACGHRVITLVHVDVVDFITSLYLKRRMNPARLTAGWRWLRKTGLTAITPDILKLIFDKQESAYTHSDHIVVPSEGMKRTILECYPAVPSSRVAVIPWGHPSLLPPTPPSPESLRMWKQRWDIREGEFVILTLSRISEEKGIDRLLLGVAELKRLRPELAARTHVLIAGDAAYMTGPRYLRRLKGLAAGLRRARVTFTGHLTGEDKACAFASARLYAFLSRHESYGLTLAEALASGLPAIISGEVAQRHDTGPHAIPVADAQDLAGKLAIILENAPVERLSTSEIPLFHHAADRLLALML